MSIANNYSNMQIFYMTPTINSVGFGSKQANIQFYIANRPAIDDYPHLNELRGLAAGEISHIVKNTSNHWRKVFNVYAKFLFAWHTQQGREDLPNSWQQYRDATLFQSASQEALLFSAPVFDTRHTIHIIAGKTYTASLALPPLIWVDKYFAINKIHRLIVSPYPDYRQLSNERIAQLIELIKALY